MNYIEKVGAHHVDCDGDDGGDVSDGGDVEDSHDLPCNLSIHWNVTNASRTVTNNKLSCYCFGFLFFLHTSICILSFSYFFWIHGRPAHIM